MTRTTRVGERQINWSEISSPLRMFAYRNGLTKLESQVLLCVAHGMTNTAIGEELDRTFHSVKGSLRLMFAKLGVDDRAQAVWVACQNGLLDVLDKPAEVTVEGMRELSGWLDYDAQREARLKKLRDTLSSLVALLDEGPDSSVSWWQWKQDLESARQRARGLVAEIVPLERAA